MDKTFKTKLSIDECKTILRNNIKSFVSESWNTTCLVGKIKKNKFNFFYHEANQKDKLNIIANGNFTSTNNETILNIKYISALHTKNYYILNFIIVIIISIIGLSISGFNYSLIDSIIKITEAYIILSMASTIYGFYSVNSKTNQIRKDQIEKYLINLLKLKENTAI